MKHWLCNQRDNISQGLPWRTCLNIIRVEQKPSSAHDSLICDLKYLSDRITYKAKKPFTLSCSQQCCTSMPQDHLTWGEPSRTIAHPAKKDSLTEQAKRLSWSSAKGRGDYTSRYLPWGRNLVKHTTTLKGNYSFFVPKIYTETLQVPSVFLPHSMFFSKIKFAFLSTCQGGKNGGEEFVACLKRWGETHRIPKEEIVFACKSAK